MRLAGCSLSRACVRPAPETMPLPVFDTKEAIPTADAADFVEYKGKWHQKDYVAAVTESERVKAINASLIGEKTTAEQLAAAEKVRADTAEAAAKTGKTQEELNAFVKPVQDKLTAAEQRALDLQKKLDRTELERLARSTKETGLMVDRLDDPDNMDVVLRNVTLVNGQPVVNGPDGKPTATPFADHLKSFLPTKPWLYKHPGGSGGGGEHGEPAPAGSPTTAEQGIAQVNARRASGHNPLAPQSAPPPAVKT